MSNAMATKPVKLLAACPLTTRPVKLLAACPHCSSDAAADTTAMLPTTAVPVTRLAMGNDTGSCLSKA